MVYHARTETEIVGNPLYNPEPSRNAYEDQMAGRPTGVRVRRVGLPVKIQKCGHEMMEKRVCTRCLLRDMIEAGTVWK